jgi:peptide/nickel transport system substrate-binding protein
LPQRARRPGRRANEEAATTLTALQAGTEIEIRRTAFRRLLAILEREDRSYGDLHQIATFIAKQRDITWRPAASFVISFRVSKSGTKWLSNRRGSCRAPLRS